MKKIFIFAIAILGIALVSCNGSETANENATDSIPAVDSTEVVSDSTVVDTLN